MGLKNIQNHRSGLIIKIRKKEKFEDQSENLSDGMVC
jgi:hypothetical protein